ncbi:MAG: hypothetical protein DRO11_08565, partial [Methanobacteriota archaeon]
MEKRKLIKYFSVPVALTIICIVLFYPWVYTGTQAWYYKFEGLKLNDQLVPQNVFVTVKNDKGEIIDQIEIHNNLTTSGLNEWMRHRLFNSSFTVGAAHYIAIGTGSDDGNPTNNNDLVNQIDCKAATPWIPGDGQFGLNATFTFGAAYTITEAGVKTGTGAYPSAYLVFYVNDLNVSVDSSWTLQICWIATIQQG